MPNMLTTNGGFSCLLFSQFIEVFLTRGDSHFLIELGWRQGVAQQIGDIRRIWIHIILVNTVIARENLVYYTSQLVGVILANKNELLVLAGIDRERERFGLIFVSRSDLQSF